MRLTTPGMIIRKRLIWLGVIITLLFFAVVVRVGRLTIVDAEALTAGAWRSGRARA